MGDPPLLAGAVKATLAAPVCGVTSNAVGAPGIVMGVTEAEGADAADDPAPFVATTVKV